MPRPLEIEDEYLNSHLMHVRNRCEDEDLNPHVMGV